MAQNVGETGAKRFTLTANASEKVTLPSWARAFAVYAESVGSVRVAPGDDATAVEGSTSPANYRTVGVGLQLGPELLPRASGSKKPPVQSIWVHSSSAAVVVVTAYESVT